jgi:hypothetical protein
MSWSISYLGEPEKVAAALEEANSGLTDQSKEEWEAAKPHLIALVRMNIGNNTVVKLNASGSGSKQGGKLISSSCQVTLEISYTTLV